MAPRRNNQQHAAGAGNDVQAFGIDPDAIENHDANTTRCCVPTGECLRAAANPSVGDTINLNDLRDAVKVTCNNDHCSVGQYMHRECFDAWEQTVLTYLKSCGRARSWSERQRHQNLWTKKGYDLAFKACGCRCGRGHLKKDLDWMPPTPGFGVGGDDAHDNKKKKRRNRHNTRPTLAVSAYHHNKPAESQPIEPRGRAGSLSSSAGSASPPEQIVSPTSSSSNNNNNATNQQGNGKKKSKFEFFSDKPRHNSVNGAGNGIFSRRQDFSSFNSLPRHKLNSYHIKMEDEGNHGNDDTRCFILSTLAALHLSRVSCVLCQGTMLVFDRYPLVDGTFFLSPLQHSKYCVEVKTDGKTQYLSAVCMPCLEGWGPGRTLRCIYCHRPWDGSSLVLGTMYSYDIFAAMHCCTDKTKCNNCGKPILPPHQRLNYYSDYSHPLPCLHCGTVDTHFVKPLSQCYSRDTWP